MKSSHDELTKKVALIAPAKQDLPIINVHVGGKKKINVLRDKSGSIMGAEVDEA